MESLNYIEKAISKLLEQDEKIKEQYYSHIYDDVLTEELHRVHHNIKRWVNQLSQIRSEMISNNILKSTVESSHQTIFIIKRRDMPVPARGIITATGFRIYKGSYISPDIVSNMYNIVKEMRRQNANNLDELSCLIIDIDFDNPGQAARFVTGKQVNGLDEWKTAEGVSLKRFLEICNDG